jgi:hypothetical protein
MNTTLREIKRLLYEKKLRERFDNVKEAMEADPMGVEYSGVKKDHEGKMARSQLFNIMSYAKELYEMIGEDTELEAWVQSKLTRAKDQISSARDHLKHKIEGDTEPGVMQAPIPEGFAQGEQPEKKIELAEATENPLIGAIEGVVKSNPLAFGLQETPDPSTIKAMIEPMVAAAMQAGMAAVASSQEAREDGSGPALAKNPITET